MSTTTMTKPPAGQQVRITSMPGNAHNGEIGVVSNAFTDLTPTQIAVTINAGAAAPPAHQNGCWIVDGWETIYPAIGDKVIPLPDQDNWYGLPDHYRTAVCTVVEIGDYVDGNGRRYIAAEFQSVQKPDDTERWSFYWCKPADGHTLTVSDLSAAVDEANLANAMSTINELRTEGAELKRELDRANERVEQLRNRASAWERDFTKYADRILEEAINRDWCEEYERVMASIQSSLEVAVIPEREQEFEVEVSVTGTMTTTTTVTVTARSQEDAETMVSENMDDYVDADDILTDAARNRSFDDIECEVE